MEDLELEVYVHEWRELENIGFLLWQSNNRRMQFTEKKE